MVQPFSPLFVTTSECLFWRYGESMETRGLGLALDLKEMVSNGKPKSSPRKVKFNYEPLIFYHTIL